MLIPFIRQATQEDAAELARLRWDFSPDEVTASRQSFAEFHLGFSDFWQRALESGTWTVWVAESEERLIANIYVQIIHKVPRPGRFGNRYGYVTNVYAEPEVRGRGIGSQLLKSVIQWAREERLEFLIVWPSEESVAYYERAGFRRSPDALELHFGE
jgi:GNAT superfamily N-acetyltransferase